MAAMIARLNWRGELRALLAFDTSTEVLSRGAAAAMRGCSTCERRGRRAGLGAAAAGGPALLQQAGFELARARGHRLRPRARRLHRPAHRLCGGPGPGAGRGAAGAAGRQPADRGRGRARASTGRAGRHRRGDGCAHGRGLCRRATTGPARAGRCVSPPALVSLDGAACRMGAAAAARAWPARRWRPSASACTAARRCAWREPHRPRRRADAPGAATLARRRRHRCRRRAAAVPARQGRADRGRARSAQGGPA